MFAEGFGHQKGAIFGFGKVTTKDINKNVTKICNTKEDEIAIVDRNVQVHNIGVERSFH